MLLFLVLTESSCSESGAGGPATGAATGLAGAQPTGGQTSTGGASAGGTMVGGTANSGGTAVTGGTKATGGTTTTGGTTASGGSKATGGGNATGGNATGGAPSGACGSVNPRPFANCRFAWGGPSQGTGSTPPSYWGFAKMWAGYEPNGGLASFSATATNSRCDGCTFVKTLSTTTTLPILHAYFIGYQAKLTAGLGDCNVDTDTHTLCTDGAQWIRTDRAVVLNMYAQYARKVHAASPNRPVIWWLEGDFFQYSYADQSNPLSFAELGALARDITCAIKANEPNAIVAMNHSPWITDQQANAFWDGQPLDVLDMVYVQASADKFSLTGSYNAATANFAWLHKKTGLTIMATESDGWTTASAATLNQRIAEGVVGVDVWSNPGNYQTAVQGLNPQLSAVCH